MENYEKLKKVIQEANPEIMELKFGCEISTDIFPSYPLEFTVVNKEYKTDVLICVNDDGELIFISFEDCEILGRPIRLADVLLAMGQKISPQYGLWRQEGFYIWAGNKESLWNVKDDNLDNQLDETKTFLINLLCKNEPQ